MRWFARALSNALLFAFAPIVFLILAESLAFIAINASSTFLGFPDATLEGRPRLRFHPILSGDPLIYSDPFGLAECTLVHPILGNVYRQSPHCRDGGGIDRYGFLRNSAEDRVIDKKQNLLIFILGGSTVQGNGASSLETTISGFLERMLRDGGTQAQVINAGQPGYFSPQTFDLLTHEILFFRPDIIISLDGINDLREANDCCRPTNNRPFTYYMNESSHRLFELANGELRSVSYPTVVMINNLKRRFYRYTFLGWSFFQLESWARRQTEFADQEQLGKSIEQLQSGSDWKERILDQGWRDEVRRGVEYYTSYVSMTKAATVSRGIRHLQVFQPSGVWDGMLSKADQALTNEFVARRYLAGGENIERRGRSFASQALAAMNALSNVIDMRGVFDGNQQYYTDGVHYNDAGNKVIAGQLLLYLERAGWLDRNNDTMESR